MIAAEFHERLAARAAETEALLERLLDDRVRPGEILRPERLMAAIRHGVLNGGKRLRPFLVIESAALFGADPVAALRVAAALECIHCFSLIHDDLPAMDDDALRRGKPTVHVAYDEATAILAGDALLALGLEIVADDDTPLPALIRVELVAALARATGPGGMTGGQALDLQAERDKPDENGIATLQAMKTGALLRFACEAGAIAAGASATERKRMAEYGRTIGLAFQIADDLLDHTGTTQSLGKAAGKDHTAGKATFVSLHGPDWARARLGDLVEEATALLTTYGERGEVLRDTARFIALREK